MGGDRCYYRARTGVLDNLCTVFWVAQHAQLSRTDHLRLAERVSQALDVNLLGADRLRRQLLEGVY